MFELTVNDMTCGHCASTITRAVKEVDSDARCEIDLGKKQVRVTSSKPAADFLAAIQEAGYTPEIRSTSAS
jgi:copper chaperone